MVALSNLIPGEHISSFRVEAQNPTTNYVSDVKRLYLLGA